MAKRGMRDKTWNLLLAQTLRPFASSNEIRSMRGADHLPSTVHRSLDALERDGYLSSIDHYSEVRNKAVKRRFPTEKTVALLCDHFERSEEIILKSFRIHKRIQDSLLHRIDNVALCYKLAADIGDKLDGTRAIPVTVEFETSGPVDAVIRLSDDRNLAVAVQTVTHTPKSSGDKLWTMSRETRLPSKYLVITTDRFEKRRAKVRLGRFQRSIPTAVATVREVMALGPDVRSWLYPIGQRERALADVLNESLPTRGYLPVWRSHPKNVYMPADFQGAEYYPLTVRQRRVLRLLSDWPLLKFNDLKVLMGGLYTKVVKTMLDELIELSLVSTRVRMLKSQRYALSDDGLMLLQRGNRTSLANAKKSWSLDSPDPQHGRLIRKLIREARHTDGIQRFASKLKSEHRGGLEIVPEHRAARNYFMGGKNYIIRPDAAFILQVDGRRQTVVLEYERSATTPSKLRLKIRAWLNYMSGPHAIDEFEGQLILLFVFPTSVVERKFLTLASEMCRERNLTLPAATSNEDLLWTQDGKIKGASWWRLGGDYVRERVMITQRR